MLTKVQLTHFVALELYCDIGRQIGAIVFHQSIIDMNTDLAKQTKYFFSDESCVHLGGCSFAFGVAFGHNCTVPKSLLGQSPLERAAAHFSVKEVLA